MPEDDKESMPDQYKTVSLEEFVEYSKSMFAYKNAIDKSDKQLAKQMVQCYYNHEKNKLEVNFMDSCDGYGRSRKHGAFSCEQGTAVCGK